MIPGIVTSRYAEHTHTHTHRAARTQTVSERILGFPRREKDGSIASLTATPVPFSFSNESSSHLVLPYRYSMVFFRANVTAGRRSISLSRGDCDAAATLSVASAHVVMSRIRRSQPTTRLACPRGACSRRKPSKTTSWSHRKRTKRTLRRRVEDRAAGPCRYRRRRRRVTPAPASSSRGRLFRLARPPASRLAKESERGIDPVVCAGVATLTPARRTNDTGGLILRMRPRPGINAPIYRVC